LNSLDQIAAFLMTGSQTFSALCADFGAGPDCASSSQATQSSSQSGDVTDIPALESGFGSNLVLLGSETDPNLSVPLNFNHSISDPADVILVAAGDAVPEPASIFLLGGGLLIFGLFASNRKSGRNFE
jgi:hypothetical protein